MNIVLDLDETLVSVTCTLPKSSYDFEFSLGNIKYYVKKRPNLSLFLRYVFKNFATVSVWTAATKDYAKEILKNIMSDSQRSQLTHFLTRRDLNVNNNGNYTKPLSKLWELGILKPNNTIMIDDRISAMNDNLGNAIIIPAWKGDKSDKYLAKLIIILDGILTYGTYMTFNKYTTVFNLKELVSD